MPLIGARGNQKYFGQPGTRSVSLLEWLGLPAMLALSLAWLAPWGGPSREGALALGILLFSRAYDEIAGRVSALPHPGAVPWRGCEYTAAGIVLPTAGFPAWAGWALVVVGLIVQALYAARPSPPKPLEQHAGRPGVR